MQSSWFLSYAAGFAVCLIQFLAAIPWLSAIALDPSASLIGLSFLRRSVPKALGGLLLAAIVPALRAAMLDPVETLRAE